MCMLMGAGLSFLGVGVQPPTPEWGAILSGGRSFSFNAPVDQHFSRHLPGRHGRAGSAFWATALQSSSK